MTSSLIWAIVILIIGLALLVAEVFIPSGGVLGILSTTALVGAVILAFSQGARLGTVFLIVVVVALPTTFTVAMHFWPRTPMGRAMSLERPNQQDVGRNPAADWLRELVGQVGRTVTPLRPSGITDFDGRRVDTIAETFLIEPDTRVRVVAVQGNRVVVRQVEATEEAEA
jgi:membrane-bound ClpP family serine protease